MPLSGGIFTRVWDFLNNPTNNPKMFHARLNEELDGLATGVSTSILKDGTSTTTAKIPFAQGLSTTTLEASGNVAVNTNKFNVNATNGNFTAAGAGAIAGDFAINGTKFTVAAASGNTAIAGVLSAPNQPGFSATKGGTDQTAITAGVFTKITYTTEEWDDGSFYDASNSKWTPPPGRALIGAGVRLTGGVVDTAIMAVTLYKNNSRYRDIGVQTISGSGAGQTPAVIGAIIEKPTGSDFYEVYMIATGVGDKTLSGLTIATFFQGYMVP